MEFVTNEKLTIVGAAGMIGSNMAQTAIMMGLTNNVCLYDVFSPEGVAEEMRQCGFDHVNITATTDPEEAFKDAKYVISSGGAPRKDGMTREDLLAGNAAVAKELGENIKKYCPDVKHVVIIFNPADITGLVTLLYSGLKPNQVSTLAALDSSRLQSALAKHFGIAQYKVCNCSTYGGHGEQMAVFASPVTIDGTPLLDIIGTGKKVNGVELTAEEWEAMKKAVTQGGAAIIKLRGRSSFQSPSYMSVEMIAAAMGGKEFNWPVGCYVASEKYHHIMMAMPSRLTSDGVYTKIVSGTAEEMAALDQSYGHLCALRDQVIGMGVLPPVEKWNEINPNIN
ncbi:MAG: malate dehydrogenase [Muribaculaceae bacterium]|nr:malate dehydrogenase [Muribaculaceae bacterium]